MKQLVPFFSLLLFIASCSNEHSSNKDKEIKSVISTTKGSIQGTLNSSAGVYVFKGIPYAKSPVGNLRWKPPKPVDPWTDTLDVTAFGPNCMQPTPKSFKMWSSGFMAPVGNMSEDCLCLNVWTKKGMKKAQRPVIVYIHGGGFSGGSGSVPIYDGTSMARKGVVFVTINYRLGIFGFMAHPQLIEESAHHSSGNYGILDQIAALKWVKKNIVNFGGNPSNVTIAGQSAGATSVNILVASPLATGLFEKVIAESGGAFGRLPTLKKEGKIGEKITDLLHIKDISSLRQLSADSLLKIQEKGYSFGPNVDGYLLPKSVLDLFSEDQYNNVPVLMGWNADDGNFIQYFKDHFMNSYEFHRYIKKKFENNLKHKFLLFPAKNDSIAKESQIKFYTLSHFAVQPWIWMKWQNKTQGEDVYLYYFKRNLPYSDKNNDYGAFHTGEVPYAYANLKQVNRPWTPTDSQLSEKMAEYWVNFARNSDPNGKRMPYWSSSNKQNNYEIMIFGDNINHHHMPYKKALYVLGDYLNLNTQTH